MRNTVISYFIYLLSLCLLSNCTQKKKENRETSEKLPGHITLIFKNAPEPKAFPGPGNYGYTTFYGTSWLFYYDDNLIKREIDVERNTIDTISIQTQQPYLEIIHDDNTYDRLNYYFKNGDTLIFNYKNYKPWVSSVKKTADENILNYELVKRKFVSDSFYTASAQYIYPYTFALSTIHKLANKSKDNFKELTKRYQQSVGEKFLKELDKEQYFLDSLKSKMSTEVYSFYKTTIDSYRKIYDLHNNSLRKTNMDSYMVSGALLDPATISFVQAGDKNLTSSAYREFLRTYIDKKYKDNIEHLDHGSSYPLDYRKLYDSIVADTILPPKTKKFKMLENILKIGNTFSEEDLKTYLNKFEKTIKDSVLISYIKEKYMLDFSSLKKETNDTHIININKEKSTLKTLLSQNKGKVIYIDFWASWCAPCRAAMPASKRLQKEYKEVVFVYLSLDRDFESWKMASSEEGLTLNTYNVLAVNYPVAEFYKELKLKSIPRYILYDKQGNLIYANAPKPGSEKIKKILNDALRE